MFRTTLRGSREKLEAAICRKCYIHPVVITRYLDGKLAETLRVKADAEISDHLHELKPEEAAVLSLLRGELDRRSQSGHPVR